jgi:glycosyltransferase involved in cell wall biosynthesis
LFPARILWDKGVGEFVAAARLLHQRNIQARFVLVGESDPGNPTGVPLQTLNVWNEEGIVEWWGWRDDMSTIYSQANIICLPSYREGLPKTLIEAAAAARAIITTDVPGCREVVINGHNGILIHPQDPLATANAVELLISNPTLRGRMGENGRERALQHFSIDKITKETMAYYRLIISTTSK